MKRNELAEVKKMDLVALDEKAKVLGREIADLTIDKEMNKMSNSKALKNKRRQLAQVLTVRRQKELLQELEKKEDA
ncbi:MAG: 50S ribosomal protein L29 [Armatimonadetes bacterium]|nr:MAG: 50S ribosomal protein L29 [Armatimonadota bacterium]